MAEKCLINKIKSVYFDVDGTRGPCVNYTRQNFFVRSMNIYMFVLCFVLGIVLSASFAYSLAKGVFFTNFCLFGINHFVSFLVEKGQYFRFDSFQINESVQ